jgi:ribosomal protein L16/L10AE
LVLLLAVLLSVLALYMLLRAVKRNGRLSVRVELLGKEVLRVNALEHVEPRVQQGKGKIEVPKG